MSDNSTTPVIVVGVDGSESSNRALAWAARQARLTGSALEVVMAWEYPSYYGWAAVGPEPLDFGAEARTALDQQLASQLGSDPGFQVTSTVVEASPALALLERSETASLVVVGSRGHGAFAGMLLGSVSQHLASHARCPVVIVRDKDDNDHPAGRR